MSGSPRTVLITGCSSGIGEATARRLSERGWNVYASARRSETVAHLRDAGCHTVTLDVTEEDSMREAVDSVLEAEGTIDVLVNNAGYSQSGAIERVPMEAVRRQFETNVFGAIRMAQLVLPGMRRRHWGKIVNIGSMGGRLTFPGGGLYHATKYSLEALSDALRFEVRGFGVDVILLEPGLITTAFAQAAIASTVAGKESGTDDPYEPFEAKVAALTVGTYEGPMRHLGGGPEVVARAIEKAITRRRAPTRVAVTASARLSILQRRLLPDRVWDAAMRTQFPEPH